MKGVTEEAVEKTRGAGCEINKGALHHHKYWTSTKNVTSKGDNRWGCKNIWSLERLTNETKRITKIVHDMQGCARYGATEVLWHIPDWIHVRIPYNTTDK